MAGESEPKAQAGLAAPPPTGKEEPPLYEYACPGMDPHTGQYVWKADMYDSDPMACDRQDDCYCVPRGFSNARTSITDKGKEVIEVNPPYQKQTCGGASGGSKKNHLLGKTIRIIPHYEILDLKPGFDPDDMNTDMGDIVELPREPFQKKYLEIAPKMQMSLDQLAAEMRQMQEEHGLVEPSDPKSGGIPHAVPDVCSGGEAQVKEALGKIRRLQILSSHCEDLRDNMARIAPSLEDEQFSRNGADLHCYRAKPGDGACQQLNCYRGPEDQEFLRKVQELRMKLDACPKHQEPAQLAAVPAGVSAAPGSEEAAASSVGLPQGSQPNPPGAPQAPAARLPQAVPGQPQVGSIGAVPVLAAALRESLQDPASQLARRDGPARHAGASHGACPGSSGGGCCRSGSCRRTRSPKFRSCRAWQRCAAGALFL